MRLLTWDEMAPVAADLDAVSLMKEAFIALDAGRAVLPPVGEMRFDQPPGEVHLKYGYIRGEATYVVKIASGFYENSRLGLPSSQGVMLLFSQKTGALLAVLADEGRLTDLRTAAAGALTLKLMAPSKVTGLGIIGSGIQARQQLMQAARVLDVPAVWIWSRNEAGMKACQQEMSGLGFDVHIAQSAAHVAAECNVVVTVTPSHKPLLKAADIRPGTHITAVGSDTPDKQELDADILARARCVVADSLEQCRLRGEIHQAVKAGALDFKEVISLGALCAGKVTARQGDDDITVADLTGVAVQDLAIAQAVYEALTSS